MIDIPSAEAMATFADSLDTHSIYRISDLKSKLSRLELEHPCYDGGFPILKAGVPVGYISQSDLKHCLDMVESRATHAISITFHDLSSRPSPFTSHSVPRSAEQDSPLFPTLSTTSSSCDLSHWVDKAPICISHCTSSDLVLELFMKMGIRTLLVTKDGLFTGIIHKKRVLQLIANE
jgi:chloride channel 3/4/5